MKIVQVNTVCERGSIPKIMLNLYKSAEAMGHTCYIAYGRGSAPQDIRSYKIGTTLDFLCHVARNFVLGDSGFGSYHRTLRFLSWLDEVQPDILHLHNIHGFYIHIELLFDYIKKHNIRTIWTLHDCWTYTGQCAYYDYANCTKWISQCHDCPIYNTSYPYSLFKDNSRNNYIRKKEAFSDVQNLTLITPSHWLENEVKKSFLGSYPVQTIHNSVDPNIFHYTPMSKQDLGKQLSDYSIDISKKIILGVANVWDNRKGLKFFKELHELLDENYLIILIGLSKKQIKEIRNLSSDRFLPITHTSNAQELCLFYHIADVFVNPTLEDNFPTTNIEALACGTPVITFDTGGSGECIDSSCGIVLKDKTSTALAHAIQELEAHPNLDSNTIASKTPSKDASFQAYMECYELFSKQK